MPDSYEHEGSNTRRLDRVETEVDALRTVVAEVRGDMRSVIIGLGEIKDSLKTRDRQDEESRRAGRPNIVAIVAVLVSIVSAMIGGAWVIGGLTARLDERDLQRDRQMARMEREIDRLESRQWQKATEESNDSL